MRIGLIGAPGSGKSSLGRALSKELGISLVDNYVQKVQKSTNLALGPWASYSEHMVVNGIRYAAEEKVGAEGRVTVGTPLDTLVYALVKSDTVLNRGARDNQDAIRELYKNAQVAIRGLTLFLTETWDYDISFYLPFSEETIKKYAGTDEGWRNGLDSAYPTVIESYGPPYTFRIEGTTKERIGIVKKSIEIINAESETT